jgi:hypothetical protein
MTDLTTPEAKLTRILYSVRSLVETDTKGVGGRELLMSYNRLRLEVRSLLPEEILEEFDNLHPEADIPQQRRTLDPEAFVGASAAVADAQQRLALLHGWLKGHLAYERGEHLRQE